MKRPGWLALGASAAVAVAACAHASIKKVSDCDRVEGEQRVECAACLVGNEAQGWLGTREYRPEEKDAGKRCVRKK